MRLRKTGLVALALCTALVAAACGDDSGSSSSNTTSASSETTAAGTTAAGTTAAAETTAASGETTAAKPTTPPRGDADLVIWADDTRAPVLRPLAEKFSAAEGVKVVVQEVPFDQIRSQVSVAGPAGEGPDIFVGADDWVGELVKNGVVAPLDLGSKSSEYTAPSISGMSYQGTLYGLPYATENIALIRNTALVPTAPATWEDVVSTALKLKQEGKVDVPLAIQENGKADPYHNFPLFTGSGGYLFKYTDGQYNSADVGLSSPGGLNAANNFAQWSKDGLINKDLTYDIMIDSFGKGKAAFAITGPWAVSDKDKGFVKTGVPFSVDAFPKFADGTQPIVFVGTQGFFVSAFSKSKDLATTFVTDYIGTPEVMQALYEVGGRPPAMTSVLQTASSDPIIKGFGQAGLSGQPQPKFPCMSKVYDTWTAAYASIFQGGDPTKAFTEANDAIAAACKGS